MSYPIDYEFKHMQQAGRINNAIDKYNKITKQGFNHYTIINNVKYEKVPIVLKGDYVDMNDIKFELLYNVALLTNDIEPVDELLCYTNLSKVARAYNSLDKDEIKEVFIKVKTLRASLISLIESEADNDLIKRATFRLDKMFNYYKGMSYNMYGF